VLFAAAMAWVESAVVYDLRTMVDRIEPYQPNPLPVIGGLGPVELVRELATLIMLLAVGTLAGRNWQERLAYTAISFGVWDIFYYVFLRVIFGWPHSLLDWDILFLVPLPWWGPVLAPVLISLLMICWGTLTAEYGQRTKRTDSTIAAACCWSLCFLGMGFALYTFMVDSLRVAKGGTEAVRHVLPVQFQWPLFLLGLVLMSAPIVDSLRRISMRPVTIRCSRKSAGYPQIT
jgi:hypothetical protein